LYASAGIPEYWILNLQENQLEIYRQPVARPEARFGWSYAANTMARSGDNVAPLAVPGASIAVSDLLP
jgi:Uma2 family endonuclease